jgi:hypothetical protein
MTVKTKRPHTVAYQELRSRSFPLLEGYHRDLLVHDRRWLRQHSGVPFIHATRKLGTELAPLFPPDHEFWPRAGQEVPYLFGHADRHHILRGVRSAVEYFLSPTSSETLLWLYYDGERFKEVTPEWVSRRIKDYVGRVELAWRNESYQEAGIRFGVIHQDDVLQSWAESSESDYGPPHCPKCGNEALPIDSEDVPDLGSEEGDDWEQDGDDFACLECQRTFWSDEAFGGDPVAHNLDDGEYVATQGGGDCDIFILKSPYYTHAQFCSPCAPGACYLRNPVDEGGPKAYCFAPDWFEWWPELGDPAGEFCGEKTSCPYPVYRVEDGECVYRPTAT